ncbi:MAG: hypothetical protein JWR61_261 [Ferruginibacter sp.]|nr:hypothetical protein [Ferruginibacter sp.]
MVSLQGEQRKYLTQHINPFVSHILSVLCGTITCDTIALKHR